MKARSLGLTLTAVFALGLASGCRSKGDGSPEQNADSGSNEGVTPDVIVLDGSDASNVVRGCFEDGSVRELGTGGAIAVSPDTEHLAILRDAAGFDVVSTRDTTAHRLEGTELLDLRWSPDGTRLAYFANGVPYIADGDGKNSHAVSGDI